MHDPAYRRVMIRRGKEKGAWLYVPAEQLEKAGWAFPQPPPRYRTWNGRKRTLLVQLYGEK